jgi:hypothetical protein
MLTSATPLLSAPDSTLKSGVDSAVLLWVYKAEEYQSFAKKIGIWPEFPRATYKGLIITRVGEATLLLADRRTCPFLSAADRVGPDPAVTVLGADKGQSCDESCRTQGQVCANEQLHYINNCAALAKVFPCEAGCGHQTGLEIPCYVHDTTQITRQQCLTTLTPALKCEASHPSTQRLCPCVDPS